MRHFGPREATLVVGDVTGRFRAEVLQAHAPDLVFLDVHAHALLREAIIETLARPGAWLAMHDCGRGLCNPRMTIAPEDPGVGSGTGVWERHVLAEAFGVGDPLDPRLDDLETTGHRLRIFDTPHGLGIIAPLRRRRRGRGAAGRGLNPPAGPSRGPVIPGGRRRVVGRPGRRR